MTKKSQIFTEVMNNAAVKYSKQIIAKITREQKEYEDNETIKIDEKPKSIARALLSKKYNLTIEEVDEEIRSVILAVS